MWVEAWEQVSGAVGLVASGSDAGTFEVAPLLAARDD